MLITSTHSAAKLPILAATGCVAFTALAGVLSSARAASPSSPAGPGAAPSVRLIKGGGRVAAGKGVELDALVEGAKVCRVGFRGPKGARPAASRTFSLKGPYVWITMTTSRKAAAGTWTVRLQCAASRARLSSGPTVKVPLRVASKRKGKGALVSRGALKVRTGAAPRGGEKGESGVSSNPADVGAPTAGVPTTGPRARLQSGETLSPGKSLASSTGQYQLVMQTDGNLVLYTQRRSLWSSQTAGKPGARAVMQSDGNLVVYGPDNVALWNSQTAGNPGASLALQDDGNAVVYAKGGEALWASTTVNSTLAPGETLTAGQLLFSPTERYRVVMQSDGNLVAYTPEGRAIWNSQTAGNPGARAVMQSDGNLVVYSPRNEALWNSGTAGRSGARFVVQDDGNLVVYQGVSPAWASGSINSKLGPGETLASGQWLNSPDGQFRLTMQGDGNFVLYRGGQALWSSGTQGNPRARAVMQTDGNLVVYTPAGQALWNSGTQGRPGAFLAVQGDGNLVIYSAGGGALWATGTNAASQVCNSSPGAGDAVTRWTPVISCVLGMLAQPQSSEYINDVLFVIRCESGGNPRAQNDSDINAQRGDPSRGLMQVIGTTFAAHRSPRLSPDIFDPAANIYAGLSYGIGRYGSIPNLPAVRTGRCVPY